MWLPKHQNFERGVNKIKEGRDVGVTTGREQSLSWNRRRAEGKNLETYNILWIEEIEEVVLDFTHKSAKDML